MRKQLPCLGTVSAHALVRISLDFARLLLGLRSSFFPFATLAIGKQIDCVVCSDNEAAQGALIEQLEWLILERSHQLDNAESVLVYLAEQRLGPCPQEVLVVTFTRSYNQTQKYIYPLRRDENGVSFGTPQVI